MYVVVRGSGRMKLDDEVVGVKEWDVVRVPPGTWRGYEGGPEGLEILVFGAPCLGENPREDVEGRAPTGGLTREAEARPAPVRFPPHRSRDQSAGLRASGRVGSTAVALVICVLTMTQWGPAYRSAPRRLPTMVPMPWTADDVPDQSGRVAVVTGASSGLGLQTALALARRGARVVLAVRDVEGRGPDAERLIRAEVPDAALEVRRLDLADLDSVRGFAADLPHDGLDLLVNNAGVMALPRRTTRDGFEMQFGTNHLGHFALTGLLLPRLLARPAPRVVTVSSGAQRMGRMAWDNLQGERSYKRWAAYGQSEARERALRARAAAPGGRRARALKSLAAHPGFASTNLQAAAAA